MREIFIGLFIVILHETFLSIRAAIRLKILIAINRAININIFNEVSRSRLSKLRAAQYRETDRQTRPKTLPAVCAGDNYSILLVFCTS